MAGLSDHVEDDSMSQVTSANFLSHPSGGETAVPLTDMTESLFLPPESLDDEIVEEASQYSNNPDVVFVAGDLPDDAVLHEDEAVAVLANYGQVRQHFHKDKLLRGYFRGKGKG